MAVDDSAVFLSALAELLACYPEVELVAECRTAGEAIERTRETAPDLILMDLILPGMNGLEATRLLRMQSPARRVIMISLHDTATFRASAAEAGAEAFLPKADIADALPMLIERYRSAAA